MATILIVSGSYFPYATANAVCAKKLEDALWASGHRVIYCNRKHDLYEPDYHVVDGTEIYTVGKNSDLLFQTIQKLHTIDLPGKMHACVTCAFKFLRVLLKISNIGKSRNKLRNEASNHYTRTYSHLIVSLIEKENVDMIMSVSMPFDSHRVVLRSMELLDAKKITRPKWIAYSIDAFWSKAGIKKIDIPAMKKEEMRVFEACDMILFLDTILEDYKSKDYDSVRDKIETLPLPLFELQEEKVYGGGISYDRNRTNFVFTGTIYDDFSNIDALASILRKSSSTTSAIHFMGKIYPKSKKVLDQLAQDYPNKIFFHGRKPYDYAKASMKNADILINLANDNTNQIPSKIFEYIACRRPILNIYRLQNDVGTTYLRKYPLAFNFNVDDMDNEIVRMKDWLTTIHGKIVTLEELESVYCDKLSKAVKTRFLELISPLLSK